jgi:hypothetical protein
LPRKLPQPAVKRALAMNIAPECYSQRIPFKAEALFLSEPGDELLLAVCCFRETDQDAWKVMASSEEVPLAKRLFLVAFPAK